MKKSILLCLISLFLTGCWETEKGEKVGTIVKFAKEGIIFGTWEAELIKGGMNEGSGAFGKSFHFTVENSELISRLNYALTNQKEVRITYHKEWLAAFWRCESDNYFLDNVTYSK